MTSSVPDGYLAVTPWAIVDDAASFLDFLATVFDAKEVLRLPGPNGIGHAEARINGGPLMIFDRHPAWAPTPAFLRVYVEDIENVLERAQAAGATVVTPAGTEWFGDRAARLRDPWDNLWWIHQRIFEPTAEQFAAGPPDNQETRERNAIVSQSLDAEMRRRRGEPQG